MNYVLTGVVAALVAAGGFTVLYSSNQPTSPTQTQTSDVRVVAAENFWGSLASQIGGSHANVVSIVIDPNVDPHEYESNPQNAIAVARANLVIQNGAGYDDWMTKLVSASNNQNLKLLNVADLLGYNPNDLTHFSNEHFWYNPTFVNKTANAIYKDYIALDPTNTAYYQQQYLALNSSLHGYMSIEANIKAHFTGAVAVSPDPMCLFLAEATGLNVITPRALMQAVNGGNDPSPRDLVTFQTQLKTPGLVKVFFNNNQTATPLTQGLLQLAIQQKIPVVSITETPYPANLTFQAWMTNEAISLQNALNSRA